MAQHSIRKSPLGKLAAFVVATASLFTSLTSVSLPANAAACASTTAPSGAGTPADPYLISSAAELIYVSLNQTAGNLSAFYQQTANIDLGECEFTPLGSDMAGQTPFSGTYDGNAKTISGLLVSSTSSSDGAGLFGALSGTVTKLGIESGSITGTANRAGLLVGVLQSGGTITEAFVAGSVTGGNNLGGMVGLSYGTVSDSWANVSVTGTDVVGGFVGAVASGSSFSRNYAIGDARASGSSKGGFVGSTSPSLATGPNFFKSSSAGLTTTASGTGMNLENFRVRANFTNFDFSSTWRIDGNTNSGRPYLAWQALVPLVATTVGTDFFTTFGDNSTSASSRLELYVSSEVDTTATLTFPSGATEVVALQAGVTEAVDVTTQIGQMYNQVLEGVTNNGVRVQSNDPISVYGIHFVRASTDAWAAIPTSSLGYNYMVNLPPSRTSTQGASSNLQIVAAEPGTTSVTITPKVDMHKRGGFPFALSSGSVVTLNNATNEVTLTLGSASANFNVGETFYFQSDLKVTQSDDGLTSVATAYTGGLGSEPKIFKVAAATSTSLTFVTDVDLSSVADTDVRVDGGTQAIRRMRGEADWDILNNSPVSLDPATDTVTISSAAIASTVGVGDVFYFNENLVVDNSTDNFTLAATAFTGGTGSVPNKFTVTAVDPGVSFSFVTNSDLSNLQDTEVLVNSTAQAIWILNPAGTPFTVTLDQGQVYNLQVDRGTDVTRTRDISGATVTSNRKVGVIVSTFMNTTPEGTTGAYDQIFEQLIPTDRWGQDYLVPHGPTGAGAQARDTLKIVARDNATAVNMNGSLLATLNAGETIQATVTRAAPGVDVISADKPISVMHITTGSGSYTDGTLPTESGDPALAVVPPSTQYLNSYVITTPATDFAVNFATLIVKKTEKALVTQAGFAIGADKFTDIPNTDYAVGRIFIPLGTHYFRAPSGFMLQIAGYDSADSYSYPGGFGLVDPVAYPNGVPELTLLQAPTKPISVGGDFISGTPTLCGTLSVNEGSWLDGRSTITSTAYQWLRNGLPISGATSSTLSLSSFSNGDLISFEIRKTNAIGTTTAFSAPVKIVDALLTNLSTSTGTVAPDFDGCTTSYTVNVIQDWLRISAGASDGTTIAIAETGAELLSDQLSTAQILTLGANTRTVTATRDGVTTSYVLTINYTSGPTVSMLAPSSIETTTATIKARANANGNQLTAASFEYSTSSDFSGSTTVTPTFTTDLGSQELTSAISGLTGGQKYYVRASVTNSVGTVQSQVFEFTTKAAPRISSLNSFVRDSSIETEIDFSVTVVSNNSPTQLSVRWSLSPDLSSPTDVNLGNPVSSTSSSSISAPLSNLPPGELIYFQLSVTNAFGTNFWPVTSFQLIGTPLLAPPIITPSATGAILELPVNPRGGETFRICTQFSTSSISSVRCSNSQWIGSPEKLDGNEFQTSRFEFTGLQPSTTYFVRSIAGNYRIPPSTTSQFATSPQYSFTTLSSSSLSSSVEGPASVGPTDSILLTFRFSEAISGFDKTDVVLSGATSGWTTQPVYQVEPSVFIMEIRPTGSVTAPSTLTVDVATPGTSSNGGNFPATNTLNIAVVNAAPVIAYAGSPFTFTQYSAITPAAVTSSGGVPATFTSSPSLPAGLSISNTGVISGTPTGSQSATNYTITAANSAGTGTATISIEITVSSLQAPQISYPQATYSFEKDSAITNVTPTLTGGTPTAFSISPALPAGLSFSTATGVISGTPTTFSTARNYTVTALNGAGSDSALLRIGTFENAPDVSYGSGAFQFVQFQAVSNASPTNVGGAASYSVVSGSLPTGLSLNQATGEISGTPGGSRLSANGSIANLTIRAANSAGFVDVPITIQITLATPNVSYPTRTVTVNSSISSASPTLAADSGGGISYSISPTLPAGMAINTSTGAITGTPTEIPASPNFTVTATNAAGSSTAPFVLTVNNRTPSFNYSSPLTANEGAAFSISPTSVLGADISYSITPALPSGLTLNTSTGAITGTPAAGTEQTATTYSVTGTNSSGSLTRTFSLAVTLLPTLTFSFPNQSLSFVEGEAVSNQAPTVTVGSPNQWSISPALPSGMTINSATGVISGTPARGARQAATTYTITGGDGTESSTFQVSIEIAAKPIQFAYSNSVLSLSENQVMTPNTVAPAAGSLAPISFTISPALPQGLSLDSSTGTISGTPAVGTEQTLTTYTITGTDGLLSETTTITIVIAQQFVVNPPAQQQPNPPAQSGSGAYSGPIITALSKTSAKPGESMAAFGLNLNTVTHIEIAGIKIEVQEITSGRFEFELPTDLPVGTFAIIAFSTSGQLVKQSAITIESTIDARKVNAGSFNGVIALYAKGYEGQRFSAKVGEDWVIVQSLAGDYVRIIERTRWVGKALAVRIYINRKLVNTIDVITR